MCLIPKTQKQQQHLSDQKLFSPCFRIDGRGLVLRLLVVSRLTKLSLDSLVRACQHLMFCGTMNKEESLVLLDLDFENIWTCQRTDFIQWRLQISVCSGLGCALLLTFWVVWMTLGSHAACPHWLRHSPVLPGGKKCHPKCFGLTSLSHAWLVKSEREMPKAFHICYLLTWYYWQLLRLHKELVFWSWRPWGQIKRRGQFLAISSSMEENDCVILNDAKKKSGMPEFPFSVQAGHHSVLFQ